MSEIDSDLDRAAASYWLSVAAKAQPSMEKSIALTQATALLRDASAETRIPDSAKQPTLNELEAPPLDIVRSPRLSP